MIRTQFLVAGAAILYATIPALAKDRPVTDNERAKLVAALAAPGCSGGAMEFDDDGHYEVDDATCSNGRKYDLEFDTEFRLIRKTPD
jgi:hypothetical protein